jgi:hypothetical protein
VRPRGLEGRHDRRPGGGERAGHLDLARAVDPVVAHRGGQPGHAGDRPAGGQEHDDARGLAQHGRIPHRHAQPARRAGGSGDRGAHDSARVAAAATAATYLLGRNVREVLKNRVTWRAKLRQSWARKACAASG